MTVIPMQQRYDTAANWASVNPVLRTAEIGHETDTGKTKIGNGATAWNSLSYWNPSGDSGTVTTVNDVAPVSGNVTLTAADIGQLYGGDLAGTPAQVTGINGQPVASGAAWQALGGTHSGAPGMTAWLTTLGNRHYASGTVVCIGTSVTAGNGASLWEHSWPVMLQTALNTRYPSNGLSTHGRGVLIPVLQWITPDYVTVTGTPTTVADHGLNLATYDISAGGGCTLAYHLTGTSAIILYANQPSGGSFKYKVDSGSFTTVSTSAGSVADGQFAVATLDASPGNAHTLTIEWDSGGAVWIDGVVEFNGDENAGMQVMNLGSDSSTTADWAAMDYNGIAVFPANLFVLELGGNDWADSVPVATMQANLVTIITKILAAAAAANSPVPQFLLLPLYASAVGPSSPPWSDYVAGLYEVAAGRSDTTVLDLSIRMPEAVTGGGPYGEYNADGEHPSDIGHSVIADIVCEFLGPQ